MLQSIRETGNTKMLLKTDGELAVVQLQEQITAQREHQNGFAESTGTRPSSER